MSSGFFIRVKQTLKNRKGEKQMTFKVIESQEQFDEAIKERLERESKSVREKVEKEFTDKYSDYDDIKKKSTDLETQVSNLTKEKEELETKSADSAKEIETLKAQSKAHETNSVKMEVALEKGLPYELAKRLNGDTKEEIEKDCDSLLKVASTKPAAPIHTEEPDTYAGDSKDGMKNAVKNMVKNIRKD